MNPSSIYLSTTERVMKWAQVNSISYFVTQSACCADEVLSAIGCRYDLSRFGSQRSSVPADADLLIISGLITQKMAPYIRAIYDQMPEPRRVLALGTCACSGGLFSESEEAVRGVSQVIPVDIYVAGCPPRPEAIMNGLIKLQGIIRGESK